MSDDLIISAHHWPDHREELYLIRTRVFIEEQCVSADDEWDTYDAAALHLLARAGNQVIGCARLLPSGRLTRMAVLAAYRHRGVGRALLQAALSAARDRDIKQLTLHAQLQAMAFYSRQGFITRGDVFMGAGIPHREMFLDLDNPSAIHRPLLELRS